MFTVTRYCIQPFTRAGRDLRPLDPIEYRAEGVARDAAARMRKRVAGLAIYAVTGEPVFDIWREPRLIISFGEVMGPAEVSPGLFVGA